VYNYSQSVTCQGANTSYSLSNLGCTYNSGVNDDGVVNFDSYQSYSLVSTTASPTASPINSASSDGVSMALWVGVAISCSIALLL